MKFENLNTIPKPSRASSSEIEERIRPVADGIVTSVKITTINSHRSTIRGAVYNAQSRFRVPLNLTIAFVHDHRDGDLTDYDLPKAKREIVALIWRKEPKVEVDHCSRSSF